MGLFEQLPYTNFHNLNLDWIMSKVKEMESLLTTFISLNEIKYANPIQWSITRQYEKNTVVVDIDGNGYLSIKAVPYGVSLERTEYWTLIGNFSALWGSVKKGITSVDEGHSTTATSNRNVNDLVWINNDLIEVTRGMIAGDSYVVGSNCRIYSMQILLNELETLIKNETAERKSEIDSLKINVNQRLDDVIYLQANEPETPSNQKSIWLQINGTINDSISVGNAETSETSPTSKFWFEPVER